MLSPALQTEYARYENGHYSYRIHRSPLCEYMINFIHKLKHLPEKYMMNSVLENFTILQVCVCGCVCRWGQMCVCRCGEKVCVYRCGKAGVCWGTGVKAGVFLGTDVCAGVNSTYTCISQLYPPRGPRSSDKQSQQQQVHLTPRPRFLNTTFQ